MNEERPVSDFDPHDALPPAPVAPNRLTAHTHTSATPPYGHEDCHQHRYSRPPRHVHAAENRSSHLADTDCQGESRVLHVAEMKYAPSSRPKIHARQRAPEESGSTDKAPIQASSPIQPTIFGNASTAGKQRLLPVRAHSHRYPVKSQ